MSSPLLPTTPLEALEEIRDLMIDWIAKIDNIMIQESEKADSSDEDYRSNSPSPEPEHGVLPFYRKSIHRYEMDGKNITIFNLPPAGSLSREETGQLLSPIDLDSPSRTPSPVQVGSYEPHPKPRCPE